MAQLVTCAPTVEPVSTHSQDQTDSTSTDFTTQDIAFLSSNIKAPFDSIRSLFDRLRAHPGLAEKPNATYPARGVFKTAATTNPAADQKLALDLSPSRIAPRARLAPFGLVPILAFFEAVIATHLEPLLHGSRVI